MGYLYIILRSSLLVMLLTSEVDELEAWRHRIHLDTPRLDVRRCEAFRFFDRPTHPRFAEDQFPGLKVEVFLETFGPIETGHAPKLEALRALPDVAVLCLYESRNMPAPPVALYTSKRTTGTQVETAVRLRKRTDVAHCASAGQK